MFEKILYVGENEIIIEVNREKILEHNIMNLPLVLEDGDRRILGEVKDINETRATVKLMGELIDDRFVSGILRKPNISANARNLSIDELFQIIGEERHGSLKLGISPFYNNAEVYVSLNSLFSNHLAIFGNSGSGKSWGVARILQNLFSIPNFIPFKSNFILFDASGEYKNAFSNINSINPNYHYRFITTSTTDYDDGEQLRIPIWLMDKYDLALLLNAKTSTSLSIIEKALKIVKIFAKDSEEGIKYKNHLIAKAIMNILYSNNTAPSKRDEIFTILNTCRTNEFCRDTIIQGIGYTRKFHECFVIDTKGQFSERVLVTDYVSQFINNSYDDIDEDDDNYYTLEDLEKAVHFTLISEGYLNNEKVYADAITLKVRLHELLIGESAKYFEYDKYINVDNYIKSLIVNENKKYQIININLEDIDDLLAKNIVKILSKKIFDFSKNIERASLPFNLIIEEAHRYIKDDSDEELLGYNIFNRISKEGRKYGVMLTVISQRPVELNETVISQCSNFMIFKMSHPRDIEYITKMIPNITEDIIEKQKSLQVGHLLAFGNGFKIPIIIKLDEPDPIPSSSNSNVVERWTKK